MPDGSTPLGAPDTPNSQSGSDPMPVFAIKAKDNLSIAAIAEYRKLCERNNLHAQADEVKKALDEVMAWRSRHPDECKLPDHEHRTAGTNGSGSEA